MWWAILALLILVPLTLWIFSLPDRHSPGEAGKSKIVVARPPEIAPVELLQIAPERARAINAAIPFAKGPLVRALPYYFGRKNADFERARDCLASAAWYEAGDDAAGERSVAQVVLNRLMHPAFPKTVCGVVFQGEDRTTGCQFTFTCDGSLMRRSPSEKAWERAQSIAELALRGVVDPSVGLATHYHTDWVVPNWSGSLDKIAQIGSHLFFRFRGFWGQRAALRRPPPLPEPLISKLATLSPIHAPIGNGAFVMPKPNDADILALVDRLQKLGPNHPAPVPLQQTANGPVNLKGNSLAASDKSKGLFALTLDLNRAPGSYVLVARSLCGDRSRCTVLGWRRGASPSNIGEFRARQGSALFSYRLTAKGEEKSLWDCREMPRPDGQCMPGTSPSDPQSPQNGD
ncbi:cell wall hydrolase [Aquisediminimonas profunda]|uniref:cell wall hydrolase n=1 Tax=Aquisediminimonas profunda TaxID=1550733 RepID=UPI001C62A21B|nr:cell wall hydrolase [Aquisediminimonas profunda]